jgi:hypothetical protein
MHNLEPILSQGISIIGSPPDIVSSDDSAQYQKDKLPGGSAQVIVDIIFRAGLFFITLKNRGSEDAYQVLATFTPEIHGVGGLKTIARIPVTGTIGFMPKGKEITTFLDVSYLYFARNEPTSLTVTITHLDQYGQKLTKTIRHDLSVYRHIGYITQPLGDDVMKGVGSSETERPSENTNTAEPRFTVTSQVTHEEWSSKDE